jgi:hypothetical protein
MEKIFVCSPLATYRLGNKVYDVDTNIEKAISYSRYVYECGAMPITPHVYFTRFMQDGKPKEREDGCKFSIELLKMCDQLWVFGMYESDGMVKEVKAARVLVVPCTHVTKRYEQWLREGFTAEVVRG